MAPGLYFRHESSLAHDTGSHPENKARIPAIEGELEEEEHDALLESLVTMVSGVYRTPSWRLMAINRAKRMLAWP